MSIAAWIWSGLALASGLTLVVGRPWTGLVAARRYEPQVRQHPWFKEANLLLTAAWTAYFATAAALVALVGVWVTTILALTTPLFATASFKVGDRYGAWKVRRTATTSEEPMTRTPAQDQLRSLVANRDDEEIERLVTAEFESVDALVDATVEGMADALDTAAAQDCVIGYEVDTPSGTRSYRIEVTGTQVQTERTEPTDARVVLQLSSADFFRLVTGLLDGTEAFMSGRMKIRGDVMFAPQISRIFRTA